MAEAKKPSGDSGGGFMHWLFREKTGPVYNWVWAAIIALVGYWYYTKKGGSLFGGSSSGAGSTTQVFPSNPTTGPTPAHGQCPHGYTWNGYRCVKSKHKKKGGSTSKLAPGGSMKAPGIHSPPSNLPPTQAGPRHAMTTRAPVIAQSNRGTRTRLPAHKIVTPVVPTSPQGRFTVAGGPTGRKPLPNPKTGAKTRSFVGRPKPHPRRK